MENDLITPWVHYVLTWIGFGTLVGLLAKAIMPGRDGGGALATVVIGILGSIIGAALLAFFGDGIQTSPISVLGFIVALGGTSLLLLTHRLLGAQGVRTFVSGWKLRRQRRHVTVVQR